MVSITPPHTLTVPPGYGYVMMAALGAVPLFAWFHGVWVTASRKGAGVPYPHPYATPQQTKANPKAYRFNCAQRAHSNLLENLAQVMLTTLVAGLKYPRGALGLVAGWMLLRAIYWAGYVYSRQPAGTGRLYGAMFWLPQGMLWGMSLSVAADLL